MSSLATVTAKQEEQPHARETGDRELARWQRRLLPFMTAFVVALAAAFFFFSGVHLYQVTGFIEAEHGQDIRSQIQAEIAKPTGQLTAEQVTQHSLLLLEADALDKRYHQASALLMSRIWSRQLAFITGMVMAFLGAVFILGKLSESTSQISGGAAEWKVAISSASPGIILSFFGTVLLIASLFVRATLDVADGPAYLNAVPRSVYTGANNGKAASDVSRPLSLDEMGDFDQKKADPSDKK